MLFIFDDYVSTRENAFNVKCQHLSFAYQGTITLYLFILYLDIFHCDVLLTIFLEIFHIHNRDSVPTS